MDAASIKIEADGDNQKVSFESTSDKITKDDAKKSLGSKADTYIVEDLKTEGGDEEKKDEDKKEKKES